MVTENDHRQLSNGKNHHTNLHGFKRHVTFTYLHQTNIVYRDKDQKQISQTSINTDRNSAACYGIIPGFTKTRQHYFIK
jgi:hypothetical protein